MQSPLISVPKKTTSDVDWTGPIKAIISQSYGESPSSYTEECSVLHRCRQDAVKGAGSDQTARDLLYKYFGQLELLELRFAEIKVSFTWEDSLTLKPTTQTSLAFEKASIIHLLASVLSSLASSTSRSSPEGVKRAYFNARATAGMLTYINENFLHAPSTDLSREVIHLLIGIMMAQSTEVFNEKLIEEKKAPGLVARSANQAAGMYTSLVDEMKEFQGKGIFDRNWLYVLQIKAKLFSSLAQYYRSVADAAAGKHGVALVRLKSADTLAAEAQRLANTFTYTFVASSTPTLPHDAATSLNEITKANATVCFEAKEQAVKDNDLIYHDILPSEAALPAIEKLPPAAPITIQEVYQNPEVSKLIGPDIFVRLVPLAVHESASVYSEEKAKLVRGEVERADINEGEIRAGLEHLGLPALVNTWRKIASGDDAELEISPEILALEVRSVDLTQLSSSRDRCERSLRELSSLLDNESRECERMRTSHFRSTISSNLNSLTAAADSDAQLAGLYREITPQIEQLSRGESSLRQQAHQIASGGNQSLLDMEDPTLDPEEREALLNSCQVVQEKLSTLSKIRRERDEVLKDLKEKLFASELEKFRPYQGRIAAAVTASQTILQELEATIRQVDQGKGIRERQRGQKDQQKRLRQWERNLISAGQSYEEVRAGLGKGLSFYESLQVVIADLSREVKEYIRNRESERNRMVSEIETRQRVGLEHSFSGLSVQQSYPSRESSYSTPSFSPPPPPHPSTSPYPPNPVSSPHPPYPAPSTYTPPPKPQSTSSYQSAAYPPPPPARTYNTQPPNQSYPSHPPPQTYQPPTQSYQPPQSYQSPSQSYQPPQGYQAPQSYQPPSQTYPSHPPPQTYQPPQQSYQPPSQAYPSHPPPQTYQPPQAYPNPPARPSYQPPSHGYQPPQGGYR